MPGPRQLRALKRRERRAPLHKNVAHCLGSADQQIFNSNDTILPLAAHE